MEKVFQVLDFTVKSVTGHFVLQLRLHLAQFAEQVLDISLPLNSFLSSILHLGVSGLEPRVNGLSQGPLMRDISLHLRQLALLLDESDTQLPNLLLVISDVPEHGLSEDLGLLLVYIQ